MNIFLIHPTTRNIGNDVITYATAQLLYSVFGQDANIVNIPALEGHQFGGLVPRQIYDINRFADCVVLGGGNLFENGQITYNAHAVEALRPPMLLLGLSHGRIMSRRDELEERTDSLRADAIRHLVGRSVAALVRDHASQAILRDLGAPTEVGGCPTLFLEPNEEQTESSGSIVISVRHPSRMCVPPPLLWRVAEDLRRLISALKREYASPVLLACHDYIDLEFASGFPEAPMVYFDDVNRYMAMLRKCKLHVSYRLHGFLPCLAFGTSSIHISYDERGKSMLATLGMEDWDIDLFQAADCVAAVLDRVRSLDCYWMARARALERIAAFRMKTLEGLALLKRRIPLQHIEETQLWLD